MLLLSLLLGDCGAELTPIPNSPAGLPYAFAIHDCAPWDGPAVTIYLTAVSGDSAASSWPQVRISVWRGADSLPGNSFAWPPDTQVGAASRCTGPDHCIHASQGRVTFRARRPDGALAGFTELVFADGTTLRGGFRAMLKGAGAFCG